MDNSIYDVGRVYNTMVIADFKEGIWTVIAQMTESRRQDGSDWESRSVAVKSMDKSYDRAYHTAIKACQNKVNDLGGDLFKLDREEGLAAINNPVGSYPTSA